MFATKNAGKPYAGKPHVRIDEGESGVAIWLPTFSTLLYETRMYSGVRGALRHRLVAEPSTRLGAGLLFKRITSSRKVQFLCLLSPLNSGRNIQFVKALQSGGEAPLCFIFCSFNSIGSVSKHSGLKVL